MDSKTRLIPPYVSYKTFLGFLATLKAQGIPSRVDRSVLSQRSGSIQSQLLLAFGYLGLLERNGRPTGRLQELVNSRGSARRAILRGIAESAYRFLFEEGLNLETATSEEIEEIFARTGASGETLRRSIAFFLSLSREAGLPVSPYIRPHRRKSRRPARAAAGSEGGASPVSPPPGRTTETKSIRLRSGGQLRLELSVRLFKLDPEDREFVFAVVDRMNRYAEGGEEKSTGTVDTGPGPAIGSV